MPPTPAAAARPNEAAKRGRSKGGKFRRVSFCFFLNKHKILSTVLRPTAGEDSFQVWQTSEKKTLFSKLARAPHLIDKGEEGLFGAVAGFVGLFAGLQVEFVVDPRHEAAHVQGPELPARERQVVELRRRRHGLGRKQA